MKKRKVTKRRNRLCQKKLKNSPVISQKNKCTRETNFSSIARFVRFILVGLLNTVFGYAVYSGFVYLNYSYLISLFIATIIGIVFNFFSIGNIVFRSAGGLLVFLRFVFAYCMVYVSNALLLRLLINNIGLNPYYGQALCLPQSIIVSWILMNYWVYRKDNVYVDKKFN